MLGHYIFYLHLLVYYTFLNGGAFLVKWNKIGFELSIDLGFESDNDTNMLPIGLYDIPETLTELFILLSWLCTKYEYHFPLELLIFVSLYLITAMAYFYTLLRPGNKFYLANLVCYCVILLY